MYTYIQAPEEGYVIIIGSSWYFTNRDESFKFCQLYQGEDMYASLSGRVNRWKPYHDEYGDWISSYMPLKDKDGNVVGGVGVDVPATQITSIRNDLLRMWIIVFLGILVLSLLIAYSLTMISRPLGKLASLTGSVNDGIPAIATTDFDVRRGRYDDEIDILSKSLKGMIDRLNNQAVELSRSQAEMRALAQNMIHSQESERKYLSHELHDEAGQLLVVLKILLSDILVELPGGEAEQPAGGFDFSSARNRMLYAIQQIEKTLGIVRDLSRQIRPPLLDVGDPNMAFREYCWEFSELTRIEIVYEGTVDPNASEEVVVSFYRFLQETLTNASKHSHPTRILVRAQMDGDWIQMSVEDNGQGGQTPAVPNGVGILGLKERFSLLGGTVEAKSVPGGFQAVARAPLVHPKGAS
jgi:signal transduction histidine kinase